MSTLPPTYVEGFHDKDAVLQMEYKELGNTGLKVSKLAFGGGALGGVYGWVLFDVHFVGGLGDKLGLLYLWLLNFSLTVSYDFICVLFWIEMEIVLGLCLNFTFLAVSLHW